MLQNPELASLAVAGPALPRSPGEKRGKASPAAMSSWGVKFCFGEFDKLPWRTAADGGKFVRKCTLD